MTCEKQNMQRQGHHVWLSESIVNSNRWDVLEEKLVSGDLNLFKTPREKQVFIELFCTLRAEYDCLIHDYYNNKYTSLSLLAWRARNLLEINTWLRFCCEDTTNAELFFNEAGKDQLELEEKLEQWGHDTNQPPEWFEKIERNKQYIHEQAKNHGIANLDSKYLSAVKAAEKFDHDKTFKIQNKILSKYAHPTAMRLFTSASETELPRRAFYFFSQGCLFFYDAFVRLESFLEEYGQSGGNESLKNDR